MPAKKSFKTYREFETFFLKFIEIQEFLWQSRFIVYDGKIWLDSFKENYYLPCKKEKIACQMKLGFRENSVECVNYDKFDDIQATGLLSYNPENKEMPFSFEFFEKH